MDEFLKLFSNYGLVGAISILILVIGFKYIPKYLDLKLKKMSEKDYMLDSFKSVIDNNTQVIKNNSKVIELNSATIKKYTDNAGKLEKEVDELKQEVNELDVDIKILMERGK